MYLKSLANHTTAVTSASYHSELDPILNKNEKKLPPTTSRFHIQQQEKNDKQTDLE